MVRYADDFVVFCESRGRRPRGEGSTSCRRGWPSAGLTLSEEKTRIVHLTEGFDFLGFNVRHYPTPETTPGGVEAADQTEQERGEAVPARMRRGMADTCRGQNVGRGHDAASTRSSGAGPTTTAPWCRRRSLRGSTVGCSTGKSAGRERTHPHKPWYWLKRKYWGQLNPKRQDRWVFGDALHSTAKPLLKFSWTPIERHILS